MTERVRWDYTYDHELELMPDSDNPNYTIKLRAEEEQPDSVTKWIDVVPEYPDDYLPDFPELLGPAIYRLEEDGLAHKIFEYADFSIESVRAILEDRINSALEASLRETDQYVIRQMETGEKMPQSVMISRGIARETADEAKQKARTARPDELPMVRWRVPPTQGVKKWRPPQVDRRDPPSPATPPGGGGVK